VIEDDAGAIWDRTVWINHLPPEGAAEFPAGTIIVRRFPDPTSLNTGFTQHAMAKRGGGFNAQDGGARGWEWFEIADEDGGASIVWRGGDSPDGGFTYNASGLSCNQCHTDAAANDFVETAALQLGHR
jgi:hypothetical protein